MVTLPPQRHPTRVAEGSAPLHGVRQEDKVFPDSYSLRRAVEPYNADLPPGAEACERHCDVSEGINTGSGHRTTQQSDGPRERWRLHLENALIPGNIGNQRTHRVTSTQHLTTSSDELVTVDHLLACVIRKERLGGRVPLARKCLQLRIFGFDYLVSYLPCFSLQVLSVV